MISVLIRGHWICHDLFRFIQMKSCFCWMQRSNNIRHYESKHEVHVCTMTWRLQFSGLLNIRQNKLCHMFLKCAHAWQGTEIIKKRRREERKQWKKERKYLTRSILRANSQKALHSVGWIYGSVCVCLHLLGQWQVQIRRVVVLTVATYPKQHMQNTRRHRAHSLIQSTWCVWSSR